MERRLINTLIVGDQDLECNCDSLGLADITLGVVGFNFSDLSRFDMIVYKGRKGEKILSSKHTKSGIIE